MKAICTNNKNHKRFSASAHVVQLWEVDELGNYEGTIEECTEITHKPDKDNLWECLDCGAEVVFKRIEENDNVSNIKELKMEIDFLETTEGLMEDSKVRLDCNDFLNVAGIYKCEVTNKYVVLYTSDASEEAITLREFKKLMESFDENIELVAKDKLIDEILYVYACEKNGDFIISIVE